MQYTQFRTTQMLCTTANQTSTNTNKCLVLMSSLLVSNVHLEEEKKIVEKYDVHVRAAYPVDVQFSDEWL